MKKLLLIIFPAITNIAFAQTDYCVPRATYSCQYDIVISNVTFNTINRSSVCDGSASGYYSIYNTGPNTTTVHKGNSYLLSVKTGLYNAQGAAAWIDYNQNRVFEADEMLFTDYSGVIPATYSRKVTIPSSALTGTTRLRVRSIFNTNPGNNPCGDVTYGETEDYVITIDSIACTSPNISIVGDSTGCDSVRLTASGGSSYLWSGGVTPNQATNTLTTSGAYYVQVKTSGGCSNVSTGSVSFYPKPQIWIGMNQSNRICAGANVTFGSYVINKGTDTAYQWKRNGINIVKATGSTYTTDSLADNDVITCLFTNSCSSDTSDPITMFVTNNPQPPSVSITAYPPDSITAGTNVAFVATTALGGASPSYQWQVNGINAGANSSYYPSNSLKNNDIVTCILTSNATCVSRQKDTSNAIVMSVDYCIPAATNSCQSNIVISNVTFNTIDRSSGCDGSASGGYSFYNTAPNTTTVHKGNSYFLSVKTGLYNVQGAAAWIDYNQNQVFEANEMLFTDYSSVVPATYSTKVTIPLTALRGTTRLRVRSIFNSNPGNNPCGNATYGETEDYVITIDSIACKPPNVSISGDSTACDSVKLTATGGSSYLWSGGITPNQVANTFYNSGAYYVQAKNSGGCSNVSSKSVSAFKKPQIGIGINQSTTICAGANVIFTSYIVDAGVDSAYQWKKNGINIVNATGSTYATDSLADTDVITCVFTNSCSSDTSNPITMSVVNSTQSPAVLITAYPSGSITAGANVFFLASTTLGGTSPAYQWQVNGINVGTNLSHYSSSSLKNNDIITCILTSNATCLTISKDTSNAIDMSVNYCIPGAVYSCEYNIVISNVTFNTINRSSGCDGSTSGYYSIYNTAPNTTTVHKGNSYLLSVKTGFVNPQGAAAWIDYNQNQVFEADEMLFADYSSVIPAIYSRRVTIPLTALNGTTRLRVRSIFNGNPGNNPCGNVSYGETEDYVITIDSIGCTPPNINISGDSSGCDSVKLTASGGASYLWSGGNTPNLASNTFYKSGMYGIQETSAAGCASAQIKNVIVNANAKPQVTITASHIDTSCSGSFVIFSSQTVNAGMSPIYIWKRNGVTISNATNSIYLTDSLANNDAILCIVNNTCQSDTSNSILMSVVPATQSPTITITASPSDTITAGTSVTFTASSLLAGTSPGYQWKVNGTDVGSNSPAYTSSNLGDGDVVTCILTSSISCLSKQKDTSNAITMRVNYCTPTNSSSCSLDMVIGNVLFNNFTRNSGCDNSNSGYSYFDSTFTTVSKGNSYLLSVKTGSSYSQGVAAWIDYDQNRVFESDEMILSGYQASKPATYAIKVSIPLTAKSGHTRLRVRTIYNSNPANNSCGNSIYGETEDYLISIDSLTCTSPPLTITGDTIACDSVRLTASGNGAYVWSGGNTPHDSINTFYTSGTYTVQVTDTTGCTATESGIIVVDRKLQPSITISVSPSTSICAGSGVTFTSSNFNGGLAPKFRWKRNGVDIPNATTNIYITDSLANGDVITCVLSNTCLSDTSNAISMYVAATPEAPAVTITATTDTITAGTYVTFTATPFLGGTSPAYQWQVNGINAGSNSLTYSTSGLADNDIVTCILASNATCLTRPKDTSNAIAMVVNYCTPVSYYSCRSVIVTSKVVFNTINRTSGCDSANGYSYYSTAPNTTTVHKGNSYVLAVTTGRTYEEEVVAWIDYNHNHLFETSERVLSGHTGKLQETYGVRVTIPATALLGATRLRVRSAYGHSPASNSCGFEYYGETEDYLIFIDTASCTIPTISIAGDTVECDSVVLTASGGVSYLWSQGQTPDSATNTFISSGTYIVQGTNNSGCTNTASKNVFAAYIIPVVHDTTISTCNTSIVYNGQTYDSTVTLRDTVRSMGGCDSIYNIAYLIITHVNLTSPSNLLPANNTANLGLQITFSWAILPGALLYDLYMWKATDTEPSIPIVANISDINYTYYGGILTYGTDYKWKVVAKNIACAVPSAVQHFTTIYLPDLLVTNIQNPASAFSGKQITVQWQVKNVGVGGTQNRQWYDYVYLSKDLILDGTDDYLGLLKNLAALNPNESYIQTGTFTLPQGINDNYYIFVVTNPYSYIDETDNTNNSNNSASTTFVQLTPPPDLQVTSIIPPNFIFSGSQIDLKYTVANNGTGPTTVSSWHDVIYLSEDSVLTGDAIHLGTFYRSGALAAGNSYSQTQQVTIPQGVSGKRYIIIITDYYNYVFEHSSEGNNTGRSDSVQVLLTPPIDLAVTQLTASDSANNNESVLVKWTIENAGGSSTTGRWQDYIYISQTTPFNPASSTLISITNNPVALTAGENYNAQAYITIPSNITGSYYIYVKADGYNSQYEDTSETNNVIRKSMRIHSPDLVVSAITIPSQDSSGKLINVSWTIRNNDNGTLYNANIVDRIFISTQSTYNANAVTGAGSLSYATGELKKDSILHKTLQVLIPNGISGDYYVYVMTDAGKALYESDEGNNISASTSFLKVIRSPSPDLQVTSDMLPDSASVDEIISISFRVKNNGPAAIVNRSWSDHLYISKQPQWPAPDAILLREIVQSRLLSANGTYNVSATVRIPATLPDSSRYYVHIVADGADSIYEHSTEGNNTRKDSIFIKKYPPIDLAVTEISVPDSGSSGKPIAVNLTVKSIGKVATLQSQWNDALYLSVDSIWNKNNDILIKVIPHIGILNINATYSVTDNITLPNGIAGRYYLLVVSDHDDANHDINRRNNYKLLKSDSTPVIINIALTLPPDFVVASFTVPQSGTAGQPVMAKYTIKNNGAGVVNAGSWTDKIYLSTNPALDDNDQVIGTGNSDATLSPGKSYSDSVLVFLPIEAEGNHVLILKTDANNVVYEHTNENNNTSNAPIVINVPPLSDLVVSSVSSPSSQANAGEPVTIDWKVKNIGANPANGYMKETVYLSEDTIKDANDILIANPDNYISIAPQAEITRTFKGDLTGVSLKDYYVLVYTDVLNNIYEENDTNNIASSLEKITVTVPQLPINVLTGRILNNSREIYYRINIPDSLIGESLIITLKGDSLNGANEMYLRHGQVPTRAVYDYSFSLPYEGNQEIIVPELKGGIYYLMIRGTSLAGTSQQISLLAKPLNFEIRSVDVNKGGNTGLVTVLISGSKLAGVTNIRLRSAGRILEANTIKIIDPTKIYVTFNLKDALLGEYDVVAQKNNGDSANLPKGFTIINGIATSLLTNVVTPPGTRPSNVISITVQYTNAGNTDIINPVLKLSSLGGSPIAFNISDLVNNTKELKLILTELNGPVGILRPGAGGSIIVYTKANANLSFTLLSK